MSNFQRVLGWPEGAALTIAAVLGSGVLYLPALTAELAGPAALVAWVGMGLLSVSFAFTLMRLSLRRPDAGGIAAFVGDAFGPAARTLTGWLFLGCMPIGAPVAALIAARYVAAVIPLSPLAGGGVALAMFAVAIILNGLGVSISGRAAGLVVSAIALLLAVSAVASAGRVHVGAFVPFWPHGVTPVVLSAALLFWAFVGWEAIAHYAEEFRDPGRDLPASLWASIFVIVVLYLAVVVVTIGTGAYGGAATGDSLAVLMGHAFGAAGRWVVAAFAVLICYGTIHTYVGGFARLVYAQARQGDFPAYFHHLDARTGTPVRALSALLILFAAVLAVVVGAGVSLEAVLGWSSALFIALYILSMAAGVRLLGRRADKVLAGVGLVVSACVLPFLGWPSLLPVVGGGIALWALSRRTHAGEGTPADVRRTSA